VCVSTVNVSGSEGGEETPLWLTCTACTVYCVAGDPVSGADAVQVQLPLACTMAVQIVPLPGEVLESVSVSPGIPRPVKPGCSDEVNPACPPGAVGSGSMVGVEGSRVSTVKVSG